jgi:hypothetical protein
LEDKAKIDANDRRWKYRGRPGVNLRAWLKSQVTDRIFGRGRKPPSAAFDVFVASVAFIFGTVFGGGLLWWFALRRRKK